MYATRPAIAGESVDPSVSRKAARQSVMPRLVAVHRQTFDGAGDPCPQLATYTRDLASPYGFEVREDVLARPHPSYTMMSTTMVEMATGGGAPPPDLVVVAYAVSEVDPRRCIPTRLNAALPGDPFGFAITDQGTASPFTALTLIGEHLRAGACRRAVLIVLEQAEVPYAVMPRTLLPSRDSAVALVLEAAQPTGPAALTGTGGPAGISRIASVRLRGGVEPTDVSRVLAEELARLPAGSGPVRVFGPAHSADGMMCTAGWWELAGALAGSGLDCPHRIVLVDHDAGLGYVCVLAVDVGVPESALSE